MSGDPANDIGEWLAMRGLGKYVSVFQEHDVDLDTLPDLSEEQLREIGLPVGACIRIRKALALDIDAALKPTILAQQEIARALAEVVTERRQVTVMFCDMVGSTRLAAELDPEDMRRLLLDYWRVVEETAARHNGYIAQHLGDGALIYFGFPVASEDDAECAILAGLDLLKSMSTANAGRKAKLQIRLGLATGTVVINQIIGSEGKVETLAIGQSVNFAARLQSLARPGSLVTDEPTRALVEGFVTFESLGLIAVDGFDDPFPLYRVVEAKRVRSRFEAQRHGVRTTFLGRVDELEIALDEWRACCQSQGRLLLVTGEPGIGKSRFVREFAVQIGEGTFTPIHLQCSPHNASSPFFPIIESLSMMADISLVRNPEEDPARLTALFASVGENQSLLLDLFDQDLPRPSGDLQQRRLLTLSTLVEFFAAMCLTAPLILVVEDLHWCDPTTLEFLDRLLSRGVALPLLILATMRPEFEHEFGDAKNVTRLPLTRLARDATDALVQKIFSPQTVSAQLLNLVAERTDGIPLFVEELLKSLDESGAIVKTGQDVGLRQPVDKGAIPRSLQSILMARVDKLRGAKRIAQIAACIGREFTLDLLKDLSRVSSAELGARLAEIVASELIVPQKSALLETFSFRHALVRDAAYNSLLFSEREAIHGEIADVLMASGQQTRPEILAHHLTAAQRSMPAIEKWCEAGEAAKLRSANAEAIEYLRKALSLVEHLKLDEARDERELTVLLALIAPLRAAQGFAATDVAQLTTRAIALADKVKDPRRILPLLYNRWVYNFVTAHRRTCEIFAKDILDRSAFDGTGLLRMTGLRAIAATQFTAGDFRNAVQNFDASVTLYDSASQTDLTQAVGLDGKVTALGYCALARWCLGEHERAHAHIRDALSTAKGIGHTSTTIFAIYHETLLRGILERNSDVLKANGNRLQDLGREHGFAMWLICGRLLESLGACLIDSTSELISAAEAHLADFADMGVVYRPTYHTFLAEICLNAGERERGLAHVESAKALIEKSGDRWNEPEIYLLEGGLAQDRDLAKHCFEKAIDVAEAQRAETWAVRARLSASRLAEFGDSSAHSYGSLA